MFALVDCNSCFASCEQIFRPDLRGKPVVVLSNNDGCIVARTKEAKALNIPDLEPYFKQKPLLDKYRVAVFSSNYELYGDISSRVMSILQEYGDTEVYSIDEAFIDVSDLKHFDFRLYASDIKDRIWRETKMPVSIGVGPTKTLAKLANHIAKRSSKLNGVCILQNKSTIRRAMAQMPVGKLWGIGPRLTAHLSYMGIYNALELADSDPRQMRKRFSVNVERTIRELTGEACIQLEEVSKKKQIICSRMFGHKVHTLRELEQAVSQYAGRACVKLRRQNSLTQAVMVQIMTNRFIEHRYKNHALIGLEMPTDDTRDIIHAAKKGLRQIFREGYPYAKAGVCLIDIIDKSPHQVGLFEKPPRKNSEQLMKLVDSYNKSQAGRLFWASDGINETWQITRRMKSPSYTTRWSELPAIICE